MNKRVAWRELSKVKGLKIYRKVCLRHHSTFRIGGVADFFVAPKNFNELADVLAIAQRKKLKYVIIGNGSNILFSDKGFRGMVIKLANGLGNVEINGTRVNVGAGMMLSTLVSKLASGGIAGLEFAYGVPATVGGAVVMNFGSFGKWIGALVRRVKVINNDNLTEVELREKDLKFGYRTSNLLQKGFVDTHVEFKLKKKRPKIIKKNIRAILEKRRATQPLGIPNAGCIFKNPPGDFAGRLIEEAGLAGKRIGDAQVSTKHANFIVNLGNATASDVIALIRKIQKTVKAKFGIRLVPEIKVVRP